MYDDGVHGCAGGDTSVTEMITADIPWLAKNLKELLVRKEKATQQNKDTSFLDRLIAKHQNALNTAQASNESLNEDNRVTDFTKPDLERFFDIQLGSLRQRIDKTERAFNIKNLQVSNTGQILDFEDPSIAIEATTNNSPTDTLKNEFVNYDYWYEMSDDHRIWKAGKAVDDSIKSLIQQLNLSEEDVARIWQKAGRKEKLPLDRFFDAHKKVYGQHLTKSNEASDPSGLFYAAKMGMGQPKKFRVHYSDPLAVLMSRKYKSKVFKARSEEDVEKYFTKKYPHLKLDSIEVITGPVDEGRPAVSDQFLATFKGEENGRYKFVDKKQEVYYLTPNMVGQFKNHLKRPGILAKLRYKTITPNYADYGVDSVVYEDGPLSEGGKDNTYFLVKLPIAYKGAVSKVIKAGRLGDMEIVASGYSDGSTSWSVLLYNYNKKGTRADTINNVLRKHMGGGSEEDPRNGGEYQHFLQVTAISDDEGDRMQESKITENKRINTKRERRFF